MKTNAPIEMKPNVLILFNINGVCEDSANYFIYFLIDSLDDDTLELEMLSSFPS